MYDPLSLVSVFVKCMYCMGGVTEDGTYTMCWV